MQSGGLAQLEEIPPIDGDIFFSPPPKRFFLDLRAPVPQIGWGHIWGAGWDILSGWQPAPADLAPETIIEEQWTERGADGAGRKE